MSSEDPFRRREERRAMLERAVADYYVCLSHGEAVELVNWGRFALNEFPIESD